MTTAKRKSKANDVLDDLLKAAARKNDLDDDKELLVRAANEIARLRALALNVIKEPPALSEICAKAIFMSACPSHLQSKSATL